MNEDRKGNIKGRPYGANLQVASKLHEWLLIEQEKKHRQRNKPHIFFGPDTGIHIICVKKNKSELRKFQFFQGVGPK